MFPIIHYCRFVATGAALVCVLLEIHQKKVVNLNATAITWRVTPARPVWVVHAHVVSSLRQQRIEPLRRLLMR